MIEKVLPIKSPPPIIVFLHYAYHLEIVMNYEEYLPNFHMNYIQLNFLKNSFVKGNIHYLEFFVFQLTECPWLNYKLISLEELDKQKVSVCDFIVDSINQGYYVRANVDEYYIPNRKVYNQTHYNHDLQIFGYNYDEKFFHISGFDKKNNYSNHTVGFEDLEKAIVNNSQNVCFHLVKKENDIHCEFDVNIVKNLLYHYVHSENSDRVYSNQNVRQKKDLYWGIEIYEGLKIYIKHLLEKEASYDIRPWQLLWEHKKNMLLRIQYMQEKGYLAEANVIYDDYKNIEQNSLSMRNIFLKYAVTQEDKLLKRLMNSIDEIVTKEHEAVTKFLHQL